MIGGKLCDNFPILVGINKLGNTVVYSISHQPLTDIGDKDNITPNTAVLVLSIITTAVTFIVLCLSVAAIVARCQKRGRILQDYDEGCVEFTKLVEQDSKSN